SYPDAKWHLDWYAGDFIFNGDVSFGASYRFSGAHVAGLSLGYMQDRDGLYYAQDEVLWRGTDSRLFHSIYLKRTINQNFLYLRHGVRFREGTFRYPVLDFYPFEENGNIFLVKETRSYNESCYQLGYEMVVGFEVNFHRLVFFDFYLGANVSKAYYESPFEINRSDIIMSDPRYSGLRPIAGIRCGILIY
ncbi:MAG: hypothetical protein ACPF9D_02615, partial [Owenweeksia sp.]